MWKKKNKKTTLQKLKKFIVNGKPMSQIIHYTIIWTVSAIIAINIVRGFDYLETATRF